MGVSAGAGSIMHLISGFGGHKDPKFKRVIPLSTGFYPTGGHEDSEAVYKDFESRAECMLLIATSLRPWREGGGANEWQESNQPGPVNCGGTRFNHPTGKIPCQPRAKTVQPYTLPDVSRLR